MSTSDWEKDHSKFLLLEFEGDRWNFLSENFWQPFLLHNLNSFWLILRYQPTCSLVLLWGFHFTFLCSVALNITSFKKFPRSCMLMKFNLVALHPWHSNTGSDSLSHLISSSSFWMAFLAAGILRITSFTFKGDTSLKGKNLTAQVSAHFPGAALFQKAYPVFFLCDMN